MSDVGQVALEDSNVALMNSDLAKSVREAAAQFEPEWEGAGKQVGIEIWRSENLGVKRWEKKEHGKFFDGDSYIVLNTYKVRQT
jgi:gelsolin